MATTTELFAEALHIAWMSWAKGLMEYVPQTKRDKWTKAMVPFAELPEEYKSQNCDYARKVLTSMGMNETLEKAAAHDSLRSELKEAQRALIFADKLLVAHDDGVTAIMDLSDMEKYEDVVVKARKGVGK
jgi:hypothetical protein